MREINFRVWSKLRNSWVYPVIDITADFDGFNDENRVFMQYTGLKDKNSKKIYEGDIIKASVLRQVGRYFKTIDVDCSGIIEYDYDGFKINIGKTKGGTTRWKYLHKICAIGVNQIECEVIGDICENPELLNN